MKLGTKWLLTMFFAYTVAQMVTGISDGFIVVAVTLSAFYAGATLQHENRFWTKWNTPSVNPSVSSEEKTE